MKLVPSKTLPRTATPRDGATAAPERAPRGPLVRAAIGLALGTAAAAFNVGCATTYRVLGGAPETLTPPARVVDAGSRTSPMAAVRLGAPTTNAADRPDPGALGPYSVMRTSVEVPCGTDDQGRAIAAVADVYLPEGAGAFAPVVHCHGLFSDRRQHQGTAAHFASHGFVVVVPDMPFGSDAAAKNEVAVRKIVDWVMTKPAILGPQLSTERGVALSGHSFGGLTATMAAVHSNVSAVVALDAARQGDAGMDAAASLHVHVLYVMGERELANQGGNGRDLYDAMTGADRAFVRVKHATHTDFQNDRLSGPKNESNRRAMTYATAFLKTTFGDARYDSYRAGADHQSAIDRGEIGAE